ncbi:MAG: alpha/beta hydrolase [Clostridia bacterium]
MPSKISMFLRAQIRLAKPFLRNLDIEADRRGQDRLGELGTKAMEDKVSFLPASFPLFEAEWAIPLDPKPDSCILYLHGGGYTAGSLVYARAFGSTLADAMERKTLCIGYRLAPENPFPAALDDALTAYKYILETYSPDKISLVGESAGGGLCFCLALHIKKQGLPLPACIVALSPWTDLTLSGESYKRNADDDPSLFEDTLREYAGLYAGTDLKNPLVSPLFGDLFNMPRSLIYVGTHEILEDDSREMAKNLNSYGADCELHVVDGMWHVFVLFGIPEAKEALSRIRGFIDEIAQC